MIPLSCRAHVFFIRQPAGPIRQDDAPGEEKSEKVKGKPFLIVHNNYLVSSGNGEVVKRIVIGRFGALGRAKTIAPAQARRKGAAESARHHLGSRHEPRKPLVS